MPILKLLPLPLTELARQEERLPALEAVQPDALSREEKVRLLALGNQLETVWEHPSATAQTRKRILRAVLEETIATLAEGRIELLLHRRGADHARVSVSRNLTGQHRWRTSGGVVDLIRGLARQQTDNAIAATLNRLGKRTSLTTIKRTGRGNAWAEALVRSCHPRCHWCCYPVCTSISVVPRSQMGWFAGGAKLPPQESGPK